jgi:hypothetical protein
MGRAMGGRERGMGVMNNRNLAPYRVPLEIPEQLDCPENEDLQ